LKETAFFSDFKRIIFSTCGGGKRFKNLIDSIEAQVFPTKHSLNIASLLFTEFLLHGSLQSTHTLTVFPDEHDLMTQ
jgi:hypothetical protein